MKRLVDFILDKIAPILLVAALAAALLVSLHYFFKPWTASNNTVQGVMQAAASSESPAVTKPQISHNNDSQPTRLVINVRKPQ